jgi:hypothetical protein
MTRQALHRLSDTARSQLLPLDAPWMASGYMYSMVPFKTPSVVLSIGDDTLLCWLRTLVKPKSANLISALL